MKITVLGSGGWGTALALLLTDNECAARAYRNIARRMDGQRTPLMKIR